MLMENRVRSLEHQVRGLSTPRSELYLDSRQGRRSSKIAINHSDLAVPMASSLSQRHMYTGDMLVARNMKCSRIVENDLAGEE